MCGRLTQIDPAAAVMDLFGIEVPEKLAARYNVAPSQQIVAVRANPETAKWEIVLLHWGLIPFWAKDKKIGYKLINARAETAASKPSFRAAIRHRRCLIPTEGFYEWKRPTGKAKGKQPYYIQRKDHRPFVMAGLWEHWESNETGEVIESCTILTTSANKDVISLHDRMPVIIEQSDFHEWLELGVQKAGDVMGLLHPYQDSGFAVRPVSTLVNSPKNEGKELLEG